MGAKGADASCKVMLRNRCWRGALPPSVAARRSPHVQRASCNVVVVNVKRALISTAVCLLPPPTTTHWQHSVPAPAGDFNFGDPAIRVCPFSPFGLVVSHKTIYSDFGHLEASNRGSSAEQPPSTPPERAHSHHQQRRTSWQGVAPLHLAAGIASHPSLSEERTLGFRPHNQKQNTNENAVKVAGAMRGSASAYSCTFASSCCTSSHRHFIREQTTPRGRGNT